MLHPLDECSVDLFLGVDGKLVTVQNLGELHSICLCLRIAEMQVQSVLSYGFCVQKVHSEDHATKTHFDDIQRPRIV